MTEEQKLKISKALELLYNLGHTKLATEAMEALFGNQRGLAIRGFGALDPNDKESDV